MHEQGPSTEILIRPKPCQWDLFVTFSLSANGRPTPNEQTMKQVQMKTQGFTQEIDANSAEQMITISKSIKTTTIMQLDCLVDQCL